MKRHIILGTFIACATLLTAQPRYSNAIHTERLGRGVAAIKSQDNKVFITWRYLSSDPEDVAFNIYRNGEKINKVPVKDKTYYIDEYDMASDAQYEVRPTAANGIPGGQHTVSAQSAPGYLEIPLDTPSGGVTPDGRPYTYSAGDASIGDVDGDGEYEIILKWDPSNARDNAHDGYTGNVLFDCYRLNGEKLWRVDLGPNIRAGAHYTQFMVYDLDGDNKAEVVMRTSDGTIDGIIEKYIPSN